MKAGIVLDHQPIVNAHYRKHICVDVPKADGQGRRLVSADSFEQLLATLAEHHPDCIPGLE